MSSTVALAGYIALALVAGASFVTQQAAGQIFCWLAIDHYGAFGVAQHPASLHRIAGALLLVGGAVLIRL